MFCDQPKCVCGWTLNRQENRNINLPAFLRKPSEEIYVCVLVVCVGTAAFQQDRTGQECVYSLLGHASSSPFANPEILYNMQFSLFEENLVVVRSDGFLSSG